LLKEYYLKKADENLPEIFTRSIVPDAEPVCMNNGEEYIIDLGNHYVGYFSFKLTHVDAYLDAPVRLKIRFCESEQEIDDDYSDYHGWICASWFQEEIINLDFPQLYKLPRRYAARYIKISVQYTPQKIRLSDFEFSAVTSADENKLKQYEICDEELKKIDAVSVNTLKNCMHRVFEDGPKRDRRLWTGDLRLEALTNYYTFNNLELVRRCLYLFAAANTNHRGIMAANIYEYPEFVSGDNFLDDYHLLYVCTLCDYYNHTNDVETFQELYPVAKNAVDLFGTFLDENGIINGNPFVDWCPGLKKRTSFHGIYLYTLRLWIDTLQSLKMDCSEYQRSYADGIKASLKHLYNSQESMFVNGIDEGQYSVHSAVWMVLSGVVDGEEAKQVLINAINDSCSVKPNTPYMHHYTVEALVKAGLMDIAEDYIKNIWGGMVKLGADTFYEAYSPGNPDFSPYEDRKINSLCHAWSCTPAYFIRKYGMGK